MDCFWLFYFVAVHDILRAWLDGCCGAGKWVVVVFAACGMACLGRGLGLVDGLAVYGNISAFRLRCVACSDTSSV
jgi:hypothetical protein